MQRARAQRRLDKLCVRKEGDVWVLPGGGRICLEEGAGVACRAWAGNPALEYRFEGSFQKALDHAAGAGGHFSWDGLHVYCSFWLKSRGPLSEAEIVCHPAGFNWPGNGLRAHTTDPGEAEFSRKVAARECPPGILIDYMREKYPEWDRKIEEWLA